MKHNPPINWNEINTLDTVTIKLPIRLRAAIEADMATKGITDISEMIAAICNIYGEYLDETAIYDSLPKGQCS